MVAEPNTKSKAWAIFDRIIADAAPRGVHTTPWLANADGTVRYEPDYETLARLLGVPLYLKAEPRTGVPALSMDVWLSYELRRIGFHPDSVWPRAVHPRVLPMPIANLLRVLPSKERASLHARLTKSAAIAGVTSAGASILGKNYLKQVDVIITDWATGPELLISTKRMDSSYAKNAANRIEESYGDVKNLRLRHPLAALGFFLGLRSDILRDEPDTAEWLVDLLGKLGREDDAYHATGLVIFEYSSTTAVLEEDSEESQERVAAAGFLPKPEMSEEFAHVPESDVQVAIAQLPHVRIRDDMMPWELSPSRFLAAMADQVLRASPVNFHREARARRRSARLIDATRDNDMHIGDPNP